MNETVVLGTSRPSEVRLSPNGDRLYSAGLDGMVRVYDTSTGDLIATWSVGQKLGGMDISPDGSFLVIVERNFSTSYRVDTTTGEKSSYTYATAGYDGLLFDVAILSNGTALFSQDFNGSGSVSLKVLDFQTGSYTAGTEVGQSSVLSRSATGEHVLIGEPNSSGGPLDIYKTGTGIVATAGAGGFNWGIQAFSGSLAAHYIYNEGIHVYNSSLQRQITLTGWNYGAVSDLVFSADSAWLFVLDNVANAIVMVNTADWSIHGSIPVSAEVGDWSGQVGATNGSRLILDPQSRYFSVATDTGLVLVDIPDGAPISGSAAADVLKGTPFADVLLGLDGDDVLIGYSGVDILDGGAGNDRLAGGAGSDTLEGGAGNDMLASANLAAITGAPADDLGQEKDILSGGEGDDTLSAGYGDDVDGGEGFDTLQLSLAGLDQGVQFNTINLIYNQSGVPGMGTIHDVELLAYLRGTEFDDLFWLHDQSGAITVDLGAGMDAVVLADTGTIVFGGDGDDYIASGAAADIIDGGQGFDRVDYLYAPGSVILTLGPAGQTMAGFGGDQLTGIEAVGGSDGFGDTLTGNEDANHLFGNGGDDTLFGKGGNDHLSGGTGNDTIDGGDGNDTLEGGDGDDIIRGGSGANQIKGDGGNDLIEVGGGYDTIDGGSGDDVITLSGTSNGAATSVIGGAGTDRLVVSSTATQVFGHQVSGVEQLELLTGGEFQSFANFTSIALGAGSYTLRNSNNPLASVALAGQSFSLRDSSLASITGSGAAETVLLDGVTLAQPVTLGGGDDRLILDHSDGSAMTLPGADGGEGTDTLGFVSFAGVTRLDLAKFTGFEIFTVDRAPGAGGFSLIVSNLGGVQQVNLGSKTGVTIATSHLSGTSLAGAFGGSLTLGAGSVIGGYGPAASMPGFSIDLEGGDAANSTLIDNDGLIEGDVLFYTGNDHYDGRSGTTGGTVFGNAGNDTLLGSAGSERFSGGFGADTLTGGGGADLLTGGAGADTFRDAAAGLNGDTITDLAAGDKIIISDATFSSFTFSVSGSTLSFSGGSLTLGSLPAGQVAAKAAVGGGVELSIVIKAVDNDFNGDGRSDILWRHDSGTVTDWLGQANGGFAANQANAFNQVDASWRVAGTGDYNGDGRADILWRHASGTVTDWLGQANGGFVGNNANAFTQVDLSWHVAGTGDFNGDGRDDVLWRHQSGTLTDWLGQANGGFVSNGANAFNQVETSWQVVGTGDYNGDGRDDLVWRHSSGAFTEWLGQANGGFASNHAIASSHVDNGWTVVGSGDFNGDGRDDLIWRHNSGALTQWLGQADGGFFGNDAAAGTTVATSWEVAATGDYNGDGRDDILWRNASGALTDWLGQANGGFLPNNANAWYDVSTSWQV